MFDKKRPIGPRRPWRAGIVCGAVAVIILTMLYVNQTRQAQSGGIFSAGVVFPESHEAVITDFVASAHPQRTDYERLAGYFVAGYLTYASPTKERSFYPGLASGRKDVDAIEGFSRMSVLLAALAKSNPGRPLILPNGDAVDPLDILRKGLVAGTTEGSTTYWGRIDDFDQRMVEASDIALALWLTKEMLWSRLSQKEQAGIAAWLHSANGRKIADSNWHLFPATINAILRDFGLPHDSNQLKRNLDRVREFYLGDGWFADGSDGPLDYYNAWGFHYQLLWLARIDPALMPGFVASASALFAKQAVHLFGRYGIPIMGRSVCYRIGASAPLIMASTLFADTIATGQARRALDLTWSYFLAHGSARAGRITQGYCGDDPRFLDVYSGPASCLWSLRSLVAALFLPESDEFWRQPATQLPIEKQDFDIALAGGRMRAVGDYATQNVVLVVDSNRGKPVAHPIEEYTMVARLLEFLRGGIRRPDNREVAYELPRYEAKQPFCLCLKQR